MVVIQGNGFTYALENRLVAKLDILVDRVTRDKPKLDSWIQTDGGEGTGKSNGSVAVAYYFKLKTGFDAHIWFRLEQLIKFAQTTKEKIIIWDEPSLDSLSTDQLKELNRNLLRLAMTIRKNRHIFIINFTKFWKFSEYVVVDRCLGMIHFYSPDGIGVGKFVYIKKKNLEYLWNDYSKAKKRSWGKYSSFRGSFPEIMLENFDKMDFFVEGKPHATIKDYDYQKDKAIKSIGNEDNNKSKKEKALQLELRELKRRIAKIDIKTIKSKEELAIAIGINPRTFRIWGKSDENSTISLGKDDLEGEGCEDIINNGGFSQENSDETL